MATLLQCIEEFVDKISVTEKQEDNIEGSISNIQSHLEDDENGLDVDETFTTGSYPRETILRPLDDIDMFAVLNRDAWEDETSQLPNPQSVLTKIKNYLNEQNDYKDKVTQDRPCVTIELSNKNFDILPCFPIDFTDGGYYIPNQDLNGWIESYPNKLTEELDAVNKLRKYKVKKVVKAVKSWNRDLDKIIPSYHIEEIAVSVFNIFDFTNLEEGIRTWFDYGELFLTSSKFKSSSVHETAKAKIKKVKDKLNDALAKKNDKKEADAIKIWKDIFGTDFPTVDAEEAKSMAKSITEGTLKIGSTGLLSTTTGNSITPSKGYYGKVSE